MKKMNTTRNLLAAIAIAVAMFAANLEAKAAVTDVPMIVGPATWGGWAASNSCVMVPVDGQEGVYTFTGYLKANEEFKFITHTDWSGDQYMNPSSTDAYISGDGQLALNGDDNKFKVSESANYTVTVDLANLTLNVAKAAFQDSPIYYNVLYLVGGNTPGGWSLGDATQLTQDAANPYKFTAEVALTADGSFKIAVNKFGDFTQKFFYRDAADDGKVSEASAGDLQWSVASAGNYVVAVDLQAMTISIASKEAAGIKGIAASKSTSADAYYSLSGARVSKTTKGIVFHNGKKIVNSF